MTFVVWVITGDHRPTTHDAANADVILKLRPVTGRVSVLQGQDVLLVRWPNKPPERKDEGMGTEGVWTP